MTDRLGNKIIAPAAPLIFAEGGEVDADDSPINTDPLGSAQQFMAQIVQADRPSPTRQSVKRVAKSTGGKEMPKEMGMNAGSLTTARDLMPAASDKGSSRQQMEDFIRVYQNKLSAAKDKARGMSSDTFGAPTLEGASLAKNTLAKKRFAKGGEAKKSEGDDVPQVTGVNKVLDFIAQRVPGSVVSSLPTSARTLLETAQGTKTPVTEANFSPKEMAIMRQLAEFKGGDKGSISYADYAALAEQLNKKGGEYSSSVPSLFSMGDPMGNVQTTLGQFRYMKDPQGNLQVMDKYDFNPPNPNVTQEARTGDYGGFGPYNLIRDYAGEKIPPGKGREVRINLGPVKKRAEGSPEEGELSQAEIDAASRPAFVSPSMRPATKISRANDPTDRILGAIEPAVTLGTGAVAAAVGMPRGIYKGLTSGQVGQGKAASIASKEAADFIERNTYVPRSESGRENLAALGKIAQDLKLAPTPGGAAMASLARPAALRAQGANIAKDFQQYNRQLAVPGASYAARPEGSTLVINKLTGAEDYSNWIPKQLDEAAKDIKVNVPQEKQDLVKNFWDVKALNYFSKQFGTESDPVYKGIKEQTIKSPALDKNFRKYALDQLAVGKTRVNEQTGQERFFPKYPEAHDDLRKRYDDMTGIEGSIYAYDPARVMDPNYSWSRTAVGGQEMAALKDREIDRMIAQGTPVSQANLELEYLTREVKDPTKIFGSNPVAKDLLAAFEKSTGVTTGNSSATVPGDSSLPQNLVTGMIKGEPLYTTARADRTLRDIFNPEYINQYLVSLPERELKNVRFEDAVKGGAKLSAQMMQRETLAADIRAGKRVPDKFFSEGVSAPLLQFSEGPLAGFAWKRIEKAESTVPEGAYVGHSVGGYAKGGMYGPEKHKQFNEGTMQVFTLRDARNRPVNTIEVKMQDSGPVVTQIKGNGRATGNKAPVDYDTGVLEFMQNYLKPARITESDGYLTPLLLSYKNQLNNARTP
jgi:hypothetical protein